MRFDEFTIVRCPCCDKLLKIDFVVDAGHIPLSVKVELCYPDEPQGLATRVNEE